MRFSSVVFDMDGTLFDSTLCVTSAFRETVAAHGLAAPTAVEVVALYPMGPPQVILSHLLGRPADDGDERAYLATLARLADEVTVYPGIVDLLDAIAERGLPIGVFTGASRAAASCLLEVTGLRPYLGALVGGDEVTTPKPAPDGILRACAQLGVDPTTSVYVGDASIDLGAARASGALAAAAGWGHMFDPGEPADVVLSHPTDLVAVLDDQ